MIQEREIVRFTLPNGARGRVHPHRVHQTPSGTLTAHSHVVRNVRNKRVVKWLPATFSAQRPPNVSPSQAWVQLSRGDATLGTIHAPSGHSRQVQVLQTAQTPSGGRAKVRVRMGHTAAGKWKPPWKRDRRPGPQCRWDFSKGDWVCPPEMTVAPPVSQGVVETTARPTRTRVVSSHRPPNPSGEREGVMTRGRKAVRRWVKDLGSGRARVVVSREGISVQPR